MRTFPNRQQGVVLFVSLIVLVAIMLAGIALVRSVDINTLIAGNLAFKQGATSAGDRGIEEARTWLSANMAGTTLHTDAPGSAYFANWQDWDFTGTNPTKTDFNWATSRTLSDDATGYTVQYVIHRLCDLAGQPTIVNCVKTATGGSTSSTHGTVAYGSYAFATTSQVYYRVTVRIAGPRNTLSYIQAVMN